MLHFYPFYWGDYSSKTFDLTMEQHGAYMLLLRHIYTTGEPIPSKHCYSIARAMTEQEKENVMIVLERFFVLDGDNWRNLRCEEVISEQNEKHLKRVEAGAKGGNAKSKALLKQRSSNATAKLKQCSSNQNQNQSISYKDKSLKEIGLTKKFIKPTLQEISDYCAERKNSIKPDRFFDFYESNGWKVGKNPMKDWKAAIRQWEQRQDFAPSSNEKKSTYNDFHKNDYTPLEGFETE